LLQSPYNILPLLTSGLSLVQGARFAKCARRATPSIKREVLITTQCIRPADPPGSPLGQRLLESTAWQPCHPQDLSGQRPFGRSHGEAQAGSRKGSRVPRGSGADHRSPATGDLGILVVRRRWPRFAPLRDVEMRIQRMRDAPQSWVASRHRGDPIQRRASRVVPPVSCSVCLRQLRRFKAVPFHH